MLAKFVLCRAKRVLKEDAKMILYGCPAISTVSSSVPLLVRLPYFRRVLNNKTTCSYTVKHRNCVEMSRENANLQNAL